jgi:hypothetical protein
MSGFIDCCRTSLSTYAPSGFRGRLEHPSRGGLAGKQFGDGRSPHLYARGPVVRLAWGRMTYIGIYPDTVGVVTTLQRMSRAGVAEATAERIEG